MSTGGRWICDWRKGLAYTENLGGVAWYQADIPGRLHWCKAQTRGLVLDKYEPGYARLVQFERCACGAVRHGQRGPWRERNSRRVITPWAAQ